MGNTTDSQKGLLELFYIECDFKLEEQKLRELEGMVSKECKNRAERFRRIKDKIRCFYGEAVARQILGKHLNRKPQEIVFVRNSYGKPEVQGNEIFYNISHSGSYVVCAVSDRPVGVDIEEHGIIDIEIARNFFAKEEYSWLLAQENQIEAFFMLWTLKESYIKWRGMGLSIPLDSFWVDISHERDVIEIYGEKNAHSKFYPFIGYSIALCSRYNFFPKLLVKKLVTSG